jgi:hypothetical protein
MDDKTFQPAQNPDTIQHLTKTLGEKSTTRFKAAKQLQLVSKADPALLYPYFDTFARLLDSSSSVLLWNAIIILSHLVSVDTERRFDGIFNRYYGHLWDGKLVTAANILGNSGRIARCRPDLEDSISEQLLEADDIPLPTAECREVARGAALNAFSECSSMLKNQPPTGGKKESRTINQADKAAVRVQKNWRAELN